MKQTNLLNQFFSEEKVRQNQVPTDLGHEYPNNQDKEEGNDVKFSGSPEIDHENHGEGQRQDGNDLNQFPSVEGFQIELLLLQPFIHNRPHSSKQMRFVENMCYD